MYLNCTWKCINIYIRHQFEHKKTAKQRAHRPQTRFRVWMRGWASVSRHGDKQPPGPLQLTAGVAPKGCLGRLYSSLALGSPSVIRRGQPRTYPQRPKMAVMSITSFDHAFPACPFDSPQQLLVLYVSPPPSVPSLHPPLFTPSLVFFLISCFQFHSLSKFSFSLSIYFFSSTSRSSTFSATSLITSFSFIKFNRTFSAIQKIPNWFHFCSNNLCASFFYLKKKIFFFIHFRTA